MQARKQGFYFPTEYRAYRAAKTRCTNLKQKSYPYYGGRGIEFRFTSFDEFFAELGPRPEGHTLDRKDTNGHYAVGNVRWATRSEQQWNRRKKPVTKRVEELQERESQRRKYKRRRARGEGSVQYKNGAFHLRAVIDGRAVSAKLCDKDDLHFSVTCPAVRELADQKLKELTAASAKSNGNGAPKDDISVVTFWENVYLPWAREVNPKAGESNLRASTIAGYEGIWGLHLEQHFRDVLLSAYETPTATEFLNSLAKTQGRNTINHIRSLMSGVFSHAVALGYIKTNPITGARVLGKTARPAKTGYYSLKEALSILAALSDVECQLVMALSFFWGLRPSEIRGLRWEDFCNEPSENCAICQDDDIRDIEVAHVHIRRAIDKQGNETGLKTDEAEQPLPLMIPIAMPLQIWREQCGNPSEGWVFENKNGSPVDLRDWVRTKIRPAVTLSKNKWRGLYAGRRGAATMLLQLTGNALASQQLLRHKPGSVVTARHYLKAVPEALLTAARQVEDAVSKALTLEAAATNGKK